MERFHDHLSGVLQHTGVAMTAEVVFYHLASGWVIVNDENLRHCLSLSPGATCEVKVGEEGLEPSSP